MTLLLFSRDILNEHEPVVHRQLKWSLSGWQAYMFEEKSVMLGYMLFSSQHESALLAVSLFVCLPYSSSRCAKWAASAHVRIFPATQERLLRSRHAFTWPNIHAEISCLLSCQYTTCFTLAVLWCCMCANFMSRIYHTHILNTVCRSIVFGLCWLLLWISSMPSTLNDLSPTSVLNKGVVWTSWHVLASE